MPEAQTIMFSHHEILELMVKKAGIREGKWMLSVNFNFAAANFGQTPEDTLPGGIVAVNKVGLTRVDDQAGAPSSLVIDATKVVHD